VDVVWPYRVEVDLALSRPPRADVTVYVTLTAWDALEASLVATHMAMGFYPEMVMPVASRTEEITDGDWWG
jgi:hypothetical protein